MQRLLTEYNIYYQASAVMVSLPGLPPDSNTWIPGGYIPPDHQKWVAVWAEAPWYFAQHQNITSWLQVKFYITRDCAVTRSASARFLIVGPICRHNNVL